MYPMSKRVAEIVVDALQQAGVRRCYGIVGDTLNHVTDAMHGSEIAGCMCATKKWQPSLPAPIRW
jgi:pyruvate dehydrogenase (quinone)